MLSREGGSLQGVAILFFYLCSALFELKPFLSVKWYFLLMYRCIKKDKGLNVEKWRRFVNRFGCQKHMFLRAAPLLNEVAPKSFEFQRRGAKNPKTPQNIPENV